jgi:hypothetical protein
MTQVYLIITQVKVVDSTLPKSEKLDSCQPNSVQTAEELYVDNFWRQKSLYEPGISLYSTGTLYYEKSGFSVAQDLLPA